MQACVKTLYVSSSLHMMLEKNLLSLLPSVMLMCLTLMFRTAVIISEAEMSDSHSFKILKIMSFS